MQSHVVTLAGIAGVPPVSGALAGAECTTSWRSYIVDNELERPVIVGHSLGGTQALWLAERSPAWAASSTWRADPPCPEPMRSSWRTSAR